MRARVWFLVMAFALVASASAAVAPMWAAPHEGTLTIGVHVTLVNRWLDPAETEALITPFMVLYPLHDALVKPMPHALNSPSLAESWTAAKDGLVYEFVLRKNAKFHNGEPVTAEDVKFSFERYKGASAKLLKDRVKEIQTPAPNRVRFVLNEPWPDFMAFYGTSATGAGWIVPKKYVEKVGDDGFKKHPIGAGPFKFVSFQPGVELVLEAFPQYWRKAPSVKRLVMRSIPDESTRAAAVKTGEADIAYLFGGPVAEELRRTPGLRIVAPLLYGMYWLDFLDQWDPKSPWHDRRVRLAASLAIDRPAINQSEMLGLGKTAASIVPPEFDFALKMEPPPFDPKRAKQLLAEAGHPNGFDAGDLTPLPPYTSLGETVGNFLQAVGIRTRVRTMERATFLTSWREKKLKGLLIGATGAAGNAAARLEPFFTKNGFFAYGSLPEIDDLFQRQAKEQDRKQREAILHQIQKTIADRVLVAPIFQQGFIWGVGPRVAEAGAGLIEGYAYVGPPEDLKLK
ncbi:MAG TPA: ABC transporter substrate-binding protein [Methylomirabilota bacterium]|jgi:peptide/nickel transport system substrate-binding protein|nr:ABC transporter substrate-binding protein [Methylomirabilota bacterium]